MSSSPMVVVKKGGVLTALVSGVFGTLIVCVICGSALGWYALNMFDRSVGNVFGVGKSLIAALPEWAEALPPPVAELLNDQRRPDYRDQLDVSVRTVSTGRRADQSRVVVKVHNQGDQTVTLLTARIVLKDDAEVPQHEYRTCIATPITIDDGDWRGPLLPGSTRELAWWVFDDDKGLSASLEITDLRVWNGPATKGDAELGSVQAAEPIGATSEVDAAGAVP